MITTANYYSEIERNGITNLPKPIQEMHESINELTTAMGKGLENFTDAEISEYYIDKQFEALEKLLNKNSPKEKEAENKSEITEKSEIKAEPKFKKGSYVLYLNNVYKIKGMKYIADNQLTETDGWHYDIGTGIMIHESNLVLTKKKVIRSGSKKEKPKKAEKEITNSITNFVELVTPEIKFIKRFVALHGKTKTQEQILSFLNSLQKAIVSKVIRKTSPYKKEIEYIQDNLILVYNKMGSKIKIEIEPERLQTLNDFAISEKQMLSITYIKQYISLHGKTGVKEKAESLLKRINKAVESGKIPENCPYMNEIKDIQIHLNEVLNDKANRLTVEAATLNSLNGICNCKNNLSGRMPNNNQKEYKFYVVFDKKYILGANEYKNDALDLMNDILENYPDIEHKLAVYTKKFLDNVLKINPNNNDNWRNYNTLHGLGFFSDMLANIAAKFIYDIPAIKESFSNFTNKITTPNNSVTPQTQPKSVHGLGKVNSMELKNMNFKNMGLKGKYAQLMGDPVEPCSIMIYGEPGSGKSTIVIDIAKTFASDYNKKIAFVAKEEGIGSTIQEKFKRLNAFHPNIDIYENHLPERINNYDFIIIDSVNEMGISYDELCKLNEQGKQNGVSFIYLFKSTKNGSFRGSQEFEHLVQVSLKVAGGIASTQKSRFGGHGSVRIFNNETQKIAKFPNYQKAEAYRNKISPNDFLTKGDDNKYWVISPEYASLLKQQGFQIL